MKMKTLALLLGATLLLQACATTETMEDGSVVELYKVREGENLVSIAAKKYGRKSEWRTILEANMDVIKDPTMIYPGQTIRLPEGEYILMEKEDKDMGYPDYPYAFN